MKELIYPTQGTCSKAIRVVLDDDDIIQEVQIAGGCHGNTQGICALVKGQKAQDVIGRVKGIMCNGRPTSCPDQLAIALAQAMQK